MSPFPRGWYMIATSDQLPPRSVMPVRALGADLVAMRGHSGRVAVFDAHCPHLGAHLGHGGLVRGDSLVCPFHGWRFDDQGALLEVPYSHSSPRVCLRQWPVREQAGLITIFAGDPDGAGDWPMVELPEDRSEDWSEPRVHRWRVRSHVQDIGENLPDSVHFFFVHDSASIPETTTRADGVRFHIAARMKQRTPRGEVDASIGITSLGLGLTVTRFGGIVETLLIVGSTPIDGEHVDLCAVFRVREGRSPTSLGEAMIANISHQIEQDIIIWEHKQYLERPVLVPGDGDIRGYRAWARQFYQDSSPR